MKTTMKWLGLILIAVGAVWFLQGINILPGSFMTGQKLWAVIGGACVAAGIGLWVAAKCKT